MNAAIGYVPILRQCSDCGVDPTLLVETACGDRLCRRCWNETTAGAARPAPAAPSVDRWIRRQEAAWAEAEAVAGGR